jgi:hypothetical protein
MKIQYDGILFDSELEVEYYKHLCKEKVHFIYHPKVPIKLNAKNNYTPDFIVFYQDRIEIIETKGYNQYSYMRDNMIHNAMLEKCEYELIDYLNDNEIIVNGKKVVYKKIKYLKGHGWVDFDFKNPNTIANKRKNKIKELESELKANRELIKNYERYFTYNKKGKLTKKQTEWLINFEITEHKRQLELTTNKMFEKTLKEVKDYE